MWTKVDTRRPLVILLLILSALAWLALWLWGQSPYSRYLSHHNLQRSRPISRSRRSSLPRGS
jgi:hypothetical protein